MRRFVIATNSLDVKAELSFAQFLTAKGGSWWHWVDNFWLYTNDSKDISVTIIRDWLNNNSPGGRRAIVIEFSDAITWSGFRPTDETEAFEWMKSVWNKK